MVKVSPNAHHSKSTITCESLMLDNESRSDTIPVIQLGTDEVDIGRLNQLAELVIKQSIIS